MSTHLPEGVFLSPTDVARRVNVSVKTIYRAVRSGELVAAQIGTQYRIAEEDFWSWIERARVQRGGEPIQSSEVTTPTARGSLQALREIEARAV